MKKSTSNYIIIVLLIIFILISGFNIGIIIQNFKKYNDSKTPEPETIIEEKTDDILEMEEGIIGYLKIDSIGLNAPVKDGTELGILKEAIGHFKESAYYTGNICFAAHNRGFNQNFFENLKNIKKDDEVIYITKYSEKHFRVSEIKEIEETNLSVLNSTENNQVTMITCIENQRNKRLCVIATEI